MKNNTKQTNPFHDFIKREIKNAPTIEGMTKEATIEFLEESFLSHPIIKNLGEITTKDHFKNICSQLHIKIPNYQTIQELEKKFNEKKVTEQNQEEQTNIAMSRYPTDSLTKNPFSAENPGKWVKGIINKNTSNNTPVR